MMTPVIDAIKGSPEAEYNRKQIRCRSLIGQCNGVLKMRFRCLLKHRVLHYSPSTASKIIYTCAVLHNMCINENVPLYINDEDLEFGMYNENHKKMKKIYLKETSVELIQILQILQLVEINND